MTAVLEVIVADDEEHSNPDMRDYWERIACGINPAHRVTLFSTIAEAERQLASRPHIVVVDNYFTTVGNEGLDFVAKNKPSHPDTIFVLMTRASFQIGALGAKFPPPDLLIPKQFLDVDKYRAHVTAELRSRIRRIPVDGTSVARDAVPGSKHPTNIALRSLIEQCIFDLRDPDKTNKYVVSLARIGGGLSGAFVYELKVPETEGFPKVSTVFKVGARPDIEREERAFMTSVRWMLPHTQRVDIVGSGRTRDHAGVCYAFAFGGDGSARTASDLLLRGNAKVIKAVVKNVFESSSTGWYKPFGEKVSITSYFSNLREFDPSKDQRRNRAVAQLYDSHAKKDGLDFHCEGGEFSVLGVRNLDVRKALTARNWGSVSLAFCHGDFNSRNIFLDEKTSRCALIDFEQSGAHHIYRDFISFEYSVRGEFNVSIAGEENLGELIQAERDLAANVAVTFPKYEYISHVLTIRAAARKKFGEEEWPAYNIASMLHAWKLCALDAWTEKGKKRIGAALLATLLELKPTR